MRNKYSQTKPIAAILLLVLIVGMLGCSKGDSNIPASNDGTRTSDNKTAGTNEISFEYLYRGFTAVLLEDKKARASFDEVAGDRVILTEDDWQNYMANYCPGIPYYRDVDFTSECLIAITSTLAKPTYASFSPIRSISADNDTLYIEYNDDPSAYIYALNTDAVTHFCISIVIVNKNDLPNNMTDDWVYTK